MSSGIIETGLSIEALEIHRSLASLQEELEAIDFYHQRVDVTEDPSLKAVLAHNRDDEVEHTAMALEWLRRAMPVFDVQLRKFLFTTGAITTQAGGAEPLAANGRGLGLGNMKAAGVQPGRDGYDGHTQA
jgi:ferritin-like protein